MGTGIGLSATAGATFVAPVKSRRTIPDSIAHMMRNHFFFQIKHIGSITLESFSKFMQFLYQILIQQSLKDIAFDEKKSCEIR